ncbi:hypothetical protein [Gordonia alkanivorans]|uniref:hypothetical protein n=1 Tax=Gordonia alkanivorans TaxID=84096 RepID=UPI001FCA48C3|nr:hypothetical protein [Gordonia alkanivorans]
MTQPSRDARRMLLPLAVVVFAAVWIGVAVVGSDELAGHIGLDGEVTRWDSKWGLLSGLGLIAVLIAVIFGGAERILSRIPARAVNFPSRRRKEYWMEGSNRDEFNRRMGEDLALMGGATLLMMAWLLAASAIIGSGDSASWTLAIPVLTYLVAVLGYTVHISVGSRYAIPGH